MVIGLVRKGHSGDEQKEGVQERSHGSKASGWILKIKPNVDDNIPMSQAAWLTQDVACLVP